MNKRATSTYYVKNVAEAGQPTRIETGSPRAAAKIFAGRNPLPEWAFEVWTEFEWQRHYSPSVFRVDEL